MPVFDNNPLEKLRFGPDAADEVIDLTGLAHADALSQVDELLNAAPAGRSYLLRFSPARGDGRETLFQPLGRKLLSARRTGRLASCLPASDAAGYLIVMPPVSGYMSPPRVGVN